MNIHTCLFPGGELKIDQKRTYIKFPLHPHRSEKESQETCIHSGLMVPWKCITNYVQTNICPVIEPRSCDAIMKRELDLKVNCAIHNFFKVMYVQYIYMHCMGIFFLQKLLAWVYFLVLTLWCFYFFLLKNQIMPSVDRSPKPQWAHSSSSKKVIYLANKFFG